MCPVFRSVWNFFDGLCALGQLMTYAAGLNTVTIVWIARRFIEEHRAALDWLNQITDEDFNFFGLEVELWKIGDSLAAPKFNLVSKPNNRSKTIITDKDQRAFLKNAHLKEPHPIIIRKAVLRPNRK